MGTGCSSQKFSRKQDAQPPLPGLPRFLLMWALREIPYHLYTIFGAR